MAYNFVKRKVEAAYRALISCVRTALSEGEAEYAVICGAPLVKMAEAEKGSYFTEGYYYNTAMRLGQEVVREAEKSGVPSWLEPLVSEMKRILQEEGWSV